MIEYITINNLSFDHLNNETSRRFAATKINLKQAQHYRTTVLDSAYAGVKVEIQKLLDGTEHISYSTDIMTNTKASFMA